MDDLCPNALSVEELNDAHIIRDPGPTWPKNLSAILSAQPCKNRISRTGHIVSDKGCGTLPTPLA